MKKSYTIKTILFLGLIAFTFQQAYAQVRIVEVNPTTNVVKIHNYGSTTVDVTSYWFCHLFTYSTLGSGTVQSGSLNLAPGAEVVLESSSNFNASFSDLGLYQTSSFASSTSMQDFTQWGSGGNGRENVAVNKGIWTAGTFVSAAPPYEYTGNGSQNGFQFWDTALGLNDFEQALGLKLYPNPTNSILKIELINSGDKLTFQVFDVLGKQVINGNVSSDELSQIDVSNLEHGLYIIKVSTGDKNETRRFIKN
ncbi:T9SS type A sorting domain-containing protein [Psychroserpens jangbogonensis]|uniref:T9SS type A sorting domain-containing protein n=1 Tax=Psychroserpens jangbogonensis TaxID=1484460 RepID=UPI00053D9EA6|nr:T9SS type A sorting domain-containing protein [Psychroserpens jangbogonensis]